MDRIIEKIWIESENYGPVLDGESNTDDNTDVMVSFTDNTSYVATFFTYENIKTLTRKNKETGECLHGKYLWASNMILIDRVDRKSIEMVINDLLESEDFETIFSKIAN